MKGIFVRSIFCFAILCALFCTACNRQKVIFSQKEEFDQNGWAYFDSLRFAFSVVDTMQRYDLTLEVTHDADYAWQNLYVKIKTAFPKDSVKTDLLSLELSDRAGDWAGSCGSGKCSVKIPLQTGIRFPSSGDYQLNFIQAMRVDPVPGIHALKLTVSENE